MAAAAGALTGIAARLYRNTGTYGSPTWTAANLVRSVTPGAAWDFSDASARETRAKMFEPTQVDLSGSFEMRADALDASYVAILAAAMARTTVDLMILNTAITVEGGMGFRSQVTLSQSGETQGPGDTVYTTFDYKPRYTTDGYPSKVLMGAASTPAFTAF